MCVNGGGGLTPYPQPIFLREKDADFSETEKYVF